MRLFLKFSGALYWKFSAKQSHRLLQFGFNFMLGLVTAFAGGLATAMGATVDSVQFPPDFGWCVATAAHQIEGGNTNSDHYIWETGAINRVISNEVLPNPDVNANFVTAIAASSSFSANNHACPVLKSEDPDPLRQHSRLFDSNLDSQRRLCEFSGDAIDHWRRVPGDIALMKELGIKEYRLSVEWAKIEPQKGVFDQAALQHYATEIRLLKAAGIEPQVTLFHFTMPQWLRSEGGWESPRSPELFGRFTRVVYSAIGSDVRTWYTMNEPMVHVTAGYVAGVLPPGEISPQKIPIVLSNMLRAHAAAYHAIHDQATLQEHFVQVGVAHHLRIFDPLTESARWNQVDKLVERKIERFGASTADYLWNWMLFDAIETGRLWFNFSQISSAAHKLGIKLPPFLNFQPIDVQGLKGTQDFFGLNYYTRDLVEFDLQGLLRGKSSLFENFHTRVNPVAVAAHNINDMGWEIYPNGLYRTLKALDARGKLHSQLKRQIIISENGIADRSDLKRERFLKDHLREMSQAMQEGIPVAGYCHWTLVDNFEWNSGYSPKFGFYEVDLKTQERRLRPSGQWYSLMIQNHGWSDSAAFKRAPLDP